MTATVITGCAIVTMDATRTEYADGYVVVDGPLIVAVGNGTAPDVDGAVVVDGSGCLLTPGFVNTHQHLYQWVTRGLAVDEGLFGWLTALYPVWARMDEEIVYAASLGALGWLARTGCTTTMDHHYVFPSAGGDVLDASVEAAREVGLRFHPTRGSMDLGRSSGGLPPDEVVEDLDTILVRTHEAIAAHHDPSFGAMLRIGVAPCSPFSVSAQLLIEAAGLAREHRVSLHTHLAETLDEEAYCRERFGCSPVDYLDRLGWLGPDVWLAHAVHLDDSAVKKLAATRTGVAHCPSSNARLGAGIARTRDLRDAGVRVGLGVDGSASNEAGSMLEEVRHALLFARAAGGAEALGVRDALELATLGGAAVLDRSDEIGSIEPDKLADLALWRVDDLPHAGIDDPVAALVLGSPPPLDLLLVNGRTVVDQDHLVTVDEETVRGEVVAAHNRLIRR
ncbi:cytosine/adenosine deaminase-related metal-dependent hydrolase [Kribbella amoyensis]|uniref:Cytosine/adenosine deaminase-related metal-dependent hydrolase n=1 Tax=Kribbella amoyensis TaxID=996641 RepID=A0A561B2P0_9ACTN|nr:8-oxoguanine deaminase [Kribbella amoyensis]TWD73133.1 cytosine/adenosine deaminase-related metal-dependent hydrolase [Kribbella amoyensis]